MRHFYVLVNVQFHLPDKARAQPKHGTVQHDQFRIEQVYRVGDGDADLLRGAVYIIAAHGIVLFERLTDGGFIDFRIRIQRCVNALIDGGTDILYDGGERRFGFHTALFAAVAKLLRGFRCIAHAVADFTGDAVCAAVNMTIAADGCAEAVGNQNAQEIRSVRGAAEPLFHDGGQRNAADVAHH